MAGVFFLRINTLPPEIPLLYSRVEGGNSIVPLYFIFLLPLLSFAIVAINVVLYRFLFKHDLFVRKLLYYASVCALVITTLIFLRIVLLVS